MKNNFGEYFKEKKKQLKENKQPININEIFKEYIRKKKEEEKGYFIDNEEATKRQ